MMRTRQFLAILVSGCVLFLAGCHGFFSARDDGGGDDGGGTGVTPSFAVAVNSFANNAVPSVASYTVNANNGALSLTTGSPTQLTFDALGVAADSAGTHFFVGAGSQGVLNFGIDRSSGVLQQPALGIADGLYASGLVATPNGRIVYALSDNSYAALPLNFYNAVFVFQVANDGSMTQSGSIRYNVPPLGAALDPSGRFLYIVDGTAGTFVYSVNSTSGEINEKHQVPANGGFSARGIALTPDGALAYISNGANSGGVDAYSVDRNDGTFRLLSGSPVATGGAKPGALAIEPTGKYLYVANSGSDSISAFRINTDGTLAAVSGSPFAAASNPVAVVPDPSGKFLYIAAKDAQKILIFNIASSGALTSAGSVASSNPVSLAVTK